MKRALLVGLLTFPLLALAQDWRWSAEDTETSHKTFKVAAGENASKLLVDQVNGYIHVTGGSGSDIQVTVERRTRAVSKARLDAAKNEVKLNMTQEGNTVKLAEDGPYRTSNGGVHYDSDDYGYSVTFNFDVEVPVGASLDLHAVNGPIEVKNTTGDFKIHAVNGHLTMDGVGGSGSMETVNGPMKATFNRNPAHDSSFRTVNGSIDLYFASSPDADMELQTLHGGVYSDFDVTTLPTTVKGENLANRFVYRTVGAMKVRAGKGGPTLTLHTLNGTIRMHSKV